MILLISDGEDDASYATQKRAEEAALQEGVSVFALETRITQMRGDKFLRKLSQETAVSLLTRISRRLFPPHWLRLMSIDCYIQPNTAHR